MKTKADKLLILSLVLILLGSANTALSQQNKITIQISSSDKQLSFAGDEIKKAAENKGFIVNLSKSINTKQKEGMIIKIISDSASVVKITKTDGLKMPQQFGWQCYSVRV